MKPALLAACVGAAASTLLQGEPHTFDRVAAGSVPDGWTFTMTGKGSPRWQVEREDTAPSKPNVLKQSGKATYPLALLDSAAVRDGFVEVAFKPLSGREDQAAGVVWRARDANNYYVCRANALESNVVLYKTVNGKRSPLDIVGRSGGYGVKAAVAREKWHTLRVEFSGPRFTVLLDGKPLFEVEDATFTGAGKVGLWTKADSVTLFDDFSFGRR
jgi:hypothetical protein